MDTTTNAKARPGSYRTCGFDVVGRNATPASIERIDCPDEALRVAESLTQQPVGPLTLETADSIALAQELLQRMDAYTDQPLCHALDRWIYAQLPHDD